MTDRVLEIARTVLAELDIDRVLTKALDGVIGLCSAERGMILLFDSDGSLLFEKARNLDRLDIERPEFQVSRTVIRRVRVDGKAFFDPNLPAHPTGRLSDSVFRLGLMAVLCLPMIHDDKVFGVVYLDSRSSSHTFTQDTLVQAETFSHFISLAAHNALERRQLRRRVDVLEQELREKYQFDALIGRDQKMVDVLKQVAQVAPSEATVLIEGESGTGKELVARALHFNSRRHDKPFVPINCGALPETLQEAELFGHERGAFTGAVRSNPGWFERADGGTIFLDEVGEMPHSLQVKFLRVLETGEYSPVGATTIRRTNVRIVAATNRDLEDLVKEGAMRRDLHYRLAVIRIRLPPLRDRPSDILVLAQHFLERLRDARDERRLQLTPAAEAALCGYAFPGNVRELQNILQRAILITEGSTIDVQHLPESVLAESPKAGPTNGARGSFKDEKRKAVEDFERDYLRACLAESKGNISQAAQIAGIDVKNFHTKMTACGIDPIEFKPRRSM